MNEAPQKLARGTIHVERNYPHSVAKVFAAWADPIARRVWAPTPPGMTMEYENDNFTLDVPSQMRMMKDGNVLALFHHRYLDIQVNQRIVYAVRCIMNEQTASTSLDTIQFFETAKGTRLSCTEQVVWMDGADHASQHEGGWKVLLDRLGDSLAK